MFYPLVPLLGSATKVSDYVKIPLFSVQVTLFPNSGISIGLTNHHSLCDASTRFNFLKAWTSIARHGTDEVFLTTGSLPFYDRAIKYPSLLDEIYLSQPGIEAFNGEYRTPELVSQTDKVRATIVLTQDHINRLKKWLSSELPRLEYISSFSVACAFVWSCVAKSRGNNENDDDIERCGDMVRAYQPVPTIGVSGTPKTKIYDVDFGWGKPKKHETISIDYNGSISVNACKDSSVDMEIGLSLPAKQMDAFISISREVLESLFM
ncbi:hypothetical protein LXL04_012971 [Taraxacum kok-saghyz]